MPTALTQNPGYISGDWSTPVRVSQTPRDYPFRATGDTSSYTYLAIYRQTLAKFSATAAFTADPENSSASLLGESRPVPVWQGARGIVAEFTRTYGSSFADQVSYDFPKITKPDPATFGIANSVLRDNTGSLIGNLTAYLSYLWSPTEVFGTAIASTSANSGADTDVTTGVAHGLTGTESFIAYNTTINRFTSGQYTVVSPTVLKLLGVNYGAFVAQVWPKLRNYTPGGFPVRAKLTQKFTDAPSGVSVPAAKLNDAAFLAAVIANTSGFVTYDTSGITFWNNTPRSTYTITELDFATV